MSFLVAENQRTVYDFRVKVSVELRRDYRSPHFCQELYHAEGLDKALRKHQLLHEKGVSELLLDPKYKRSPRDTTSVIKL